VGFEPDAVDIFTITPGVDFKSSYERSNVIQERELSCHIISLEDLIKNKETLTREGEKKKLDEYDVTVLKRILKSGSH
jgi:phage gp16-like protein